MVGGDANTVLLFGIVPVLALCERYFLTLPGIMLLYYRGDICMCDIQSDCEDVAHSGVCAVVPHMNTCSVSTTELYSTF